MGDEGHNSRIVDVPATQADPIYGIGDVVALTGISAFTIRYYDKCGFFPNLHRDKRGVRTFSEADVAQLHLVEALRKAACPSRASSTSCASASVAAPPGPNACRSCGRKRPCSSTSARSWTRA